MDSPLEKLWRIEDEKNPFKCMFCLHKWKAVRAVKYCKSCEEYFCDECGNQHWLLRSSKEHRMWMIEDLVLLKKDPLVRARLDLIFSAKQRKSRARTRRRSSIFDRQSSEDNQKEEEECDITGACFIDGNIVLADRGNKKLILVDQHYILQSVKKTPCFDVVYLNQYYMAVSCPDEQQIKLFSVYDHTIEEDRRIPVESECYGLCRVGDCFAVGLAGKPVRLRIYLGSVLKEEVTLASGKVPLRKPRYIAYHNTERFYVSDSSAHCLKSYTRTGQIVWEKKIDMCNGLSIFGCYLLVARTDRNTIDIVNAEGQILKSVVKSDTGLSNVRVLSTDEGRDGEESRRLTVVDAVELVHVFVLSDPMADDDLKTYVDNSKRSAGKDKDNDSKEEETERGPSKLCTIL